MTKKMSVKDIARLSGVSVATVSRIINQNGRFSKETEERVRKVMQENDYHPNQLARALRTHKTNVVGIIVPDITNIFFSKITLAIQEQMFDRGICTIICNTNELESMETRHLEMLQAQQAGGIVYISGNTVKNSGVLTLPSIYIDRQPPQKAQNNRKCVLIESDNVQGGFLATEELIKKGCKKIVIVKYGEKISSHQGRFQGYKNALKTYGIPYVSQRALSVSKVDMENGYLIIKQLLDQQMEFDGIFCTSDLLALGALQALQQEGIMVPQKIKIVGFDNSFYGSLTKPAITTIQQSMNDFGRLGASTLISMMEGKIPETLHYRLSTQLVVRESTGS